MIPRSWTKVGQLSAAGLVIFEHYCFVMYKLRRVRLDARETQSDSKSLRWVTTWQPSPGNAARGTGCLSFAPSSRAFRIDQAIPFCPVADQLRCPAQGSPSGSSRRLYPFGPNLLSTLLRRWTTLRKLFSCICVIRDRYSHRMDMKLCHRQQNQHHRVWKPDLPVLKGVTPGYAQRKSTRFSVPRL